ncbi:hypothetical protein PIB30_110792, partial [Stylosanthes scabra]|nr:hypothetical protein [Stylosanthes scabra]
MEWLGSGTETTTAETSSPFKPGSDDGADNVDGTMRCGRAQTRCCDGMVSEGVGG